MKPSRIVDLIGYASGWGASDPRCREAAFVLQQVGIAQRLAERGISAAWQDIYRSPLEDKPHKAPHTALVIDYCKHLGTHVTAALNTGHFPVSLGGDHSMAIGTWSAVSHHVGGAKNLGLIWIDAHMDSHTPQTSHSHNIHGMPLAVLLGHGDDALRALNPGASSLLPSNLCLIGVRSYEPEEDNLLTQLGVRVFSRNEVTKRGFDAVFAEALEHVTRHTTHFGMSIDIDAFDPQIAPGTGVPEPEGLWPEDVLPALERLHSRANFIALEIAEYNPALGHHGLTQALILSLLSQILLASENTLR